jgi:5'-deoxynucleotidase YfbR-like HD superfamily hydrolase
MDPHMSELVNMVRVAREAGHVRRCHTTPHIGEYTVGKHCYDAVSLLYLLHPDPRHELVKAILWHDLGERFVGDMPAPAKWYNPALGAEYEKAESKAMEAHGFIDHLNLEDDEPNWLAAIDRLELWLWVQDQFALGNMNVIPFKKALDNWFYENKSKVPLAIQLFKEHYVFKRTEEIKP